MDDIRTCRRSWFRTIQGRPPVEGVWFRVGDDTPGLDQPHPWGSRDWQPHRSPDAVGEVEGPRINGKRPTVWYSGRQPAPYAADGYCGSAYAARHGARPGIDPLFMTNALGQAPCCSTPPGPDVGWLEMDGGAVQGGALDLAGGVRLDMAGGSAQRGIATQIGDGMALDQDGGAAAGGPQQMQGGLRIDLVGGVAVGGPQQMQGGLRLDLVGGVAVGGPQQMQGGLRIDLVGGIVQGGALDLAGGQLLAMAGGSVQGGSLDLAGGYWLSMAGGSAQGGTQTMAGGSTGPSFRAASPLATGDAVTLISKPAGVASGDLLLAFVDGSPAFLSAPAGWTYQGTSGRLAWWSRVAGSSEPAGYSWLSDWEDSVVGFIVAFQGGSVGAKLNGTQFNATTFSLPSITTTGGAPILVSVADTRNNDSGYTITGGMAQRVPASGSGPSLLWCWTSPVATGATGTRTVTAPANRSWNGWSVEVK